MADFSCNLSGAVLRSQHELSLVFSHRASLLSKAVKTSLEAEAAVSSARTSKGGLLRSDSHANSDGQAIRVEEAAIRRSAQWLDRAQRESSTVSLRVCLSCRLQTSEVQAL